MQQRQKSWLLMRRLVANVGVAHAAAASTAPARGHLSPRAKQRGRQTAASAGGAARHTEQAIAAMDYAVDDTLRGRIEPIKAALQLPAGAIEGGALDRASPHIMGLTSLG